LHALLIIFGAINLQLALEMQREKKEAKVLVAGLGLVNHFSDAHTLSLSETLGAE
jgi:hypothetical protein